MSSNGSDLTGIISKAANISTRDSAKLEPKSFTGGERDYVQTQASIGATGMRASITV